MKVNSRSLRAFLVAPIVIAMAFTLRRPWEAAMQAAVGGVWLGLALFETFLQRRDK